MPERDDRIFEGLKRIFENPVVTAGMAIASLLLLPLAVKMQNTPEGRERLRRRMAEDTVRRQRIKRDQDRWRARNKAYHEFFFDGGRGGQVLADLSTVTIGPAQPAVGVVRAQPTRFYGRGWRVQDRSTGTELEGSWDRDGCGGIRLTLPDGTIWRLPTRGDNSGYQSVGLEQDLNWPTRAGERPLFDPEAAEIAAPLLAAASGQPEQITLIRPDYFRTRERLWNEFLDAHPELEDDRERAMRRRRSSS